MTVVQVIPEADGTLNPIHRKKSRLKRRRNSRKKRKNRRKKDSINRKKTYSIKIKITGKAGETPSIRSLEIREMEPTLGGGVPTAVKTESLKPTTKIETLREIWGGTPDVKIPVLVAGKI